MQGQDMIAYMDRGGVERALCAPPGVGAADHFAADHECIAQAIADYPDRIFGFVRVKPTRGRQAIDEMGYWLGERGFHAVKFNTIDSSPYGAGFYSLADRGLMGPVLEAIGELQAPVMIHTGEEHGHTCTPALVANLALDFPQITFIIAHAGVPGFLDEVVPFMRRAENTLVDLAGVLRPIYVQNLVNGVGAERVLNATNAPHMPIEFGPQLIERHCRQLTAAQKEAILWENALRVFKISA
jgi:predicted TIM-barrel fold metal-dependent hydrolase